MMKIQCRCTDLFAVPFLTGASWLRRTRQKELKRSLIPLQVDHFYGSYYEVPAVISGLYL